MGEALLVGRKEHPSNQAFSKWCAALGFDMDNSVRSNAMWMAENWASCNDYKTEISHPTALRAWVKEQASETPPAPSVDLSTSPAPRARITIETAKKVNKLVSMSESGEGQEQETAKKYLKKQAEKFGMKPDELSELAKKTDPMRGIDLFWFVVYHAPARGLYSGLLKPHSRSTRTQTAHHTGPHNPAFGGFLCAVLPSFFTFNPRTNMNAQSLDLSFLASRAALAWAVHSIPDEALQAAIDRANLSDPRGPLKCCNSFDLRWNLHTLIAAALPHGRDGREFAAPLALRKGVERRCRRLGRPESA